MYGFRLRLTWLILLIAFCALCDSKGNVTRPLRGWSSWSLSAIKNSNVYGNNWLTSANVRAQSDAMRANAELTAAGESLSPRF
jgi:hypothetical protein